MENKKVRILYFVDRMLKGGIQALVLEIAKNIDKNKFQLDFLLLDDGNKYELEDELKKYCTNVFKLQKIWLRKPIDFVKYTKALDDFFKMHNDYDIVHMHSSSKNYMVLKKAKKYGIKTRIAHSHNIDFQTSNIIKKFIGNLFKINLKKYATDYYACSKLAGEWLFGKKIVKSDNFKIINNAIDCTKFKYNEQVRKQIRDELKINENELVLGNVGRFSEQKNHEFLIDLFMKVYSEKKNSKLLLIGTGEKEEQIKEKVKKLNIENSVIFVGFSKKVSDYMNAMDIFVFPSKFEGLGIVLIEAQANGLHCLASEGVIPNEAKVTNLLEFINLNNIENWKERILNMPLERKNVQFEIENHGYSINKMVKKLEQLYCRKLGI